MSAYVALTEPDPNQGDSVQEQDHGGRSRSASAGEVRHQPDIRSRSGLHKAARSVAVSMMVIGAVILLFAFAAAFVPKLPIVSSVIVVAVFATVMMMAVAALILTRDDRVERWAPNLLFFIFCALLFTVPVALVAFFHSGQEILTLKWDAESARHRSRMTNELNRHRTFSALTEEQAGLGIVAENSVISLHFGILSGLLSLVEISMAFPLYMMKFMDDSDRLAPEIAASITRQLQAAGLL